MRTLTLCIALAFAPVAAFAQSGEDEGADVSEVDKDALGPLKDRVRPVSGHLFLKKGRFEVSPSATISLKDAFYTKYFGGVSLTFHPVESFGIGARLGYAPIPVSSGAAQICTTAAATRGCRIPSPAEMNGIAPGNIQLIAGVDGQWAPLYGKIALSSELFLHFDMYAVVGGALVGYTGPGPSSRMAIGGNLGAGMRIFITRWVTLRTEFRDLIYIEEQRIPATSLKNQLLGEIGFSFFFPTTFREG